MCAGPGHRCTLLGLRSFVEPAGSAQDSVTQYEEEGARGGRRWGARLPAPLPARGHFRTDLRAAGFLAVNFCPWPHLGELCASAPTFWPGPPAFCGQPLLEVATSEVPKQGSGSGPSARGPLRSCFLLILFLGLSSKCYVLSSRLLFLTLRLTWKEFV